MRNMKKRLTYAQTIALSFLLVILTGTFLLCLPFSSKSGAATPFINSLFTATSATCVTGLTVYDTYAHWTVFGQAVILSLIQIGGLGFMTIISVIGFAIKRNLNVRDRKLLMQSAGSNNPGELRALILSVVLTTFLVEIFGAILLFIRFLPIMGAKAGVWNAVFHSVSAFCNAGFDIMSRFGSSSLSLFADDIYVNFVITALVIFGGLGFLVWVNIIKSRFRFSKMGLHTKIVLITTLVLLVSGTVILFLTERNAAFAEGSVGGRWMRAFFQSVTLRTAGFSTVPQADLSQGGTLVSSAFMLIGGSPGSTAGGFKTTTLAVFLLSAYYSARNVEDIVVFKRHITDRVVKRAASVICIYLFAAVTATVVICTIEGLTLNKGLFEVCSALGTVGLSMNLTASLGSASKLILAFLMYSGRLGGLTLMLAFSEKRAQPPVQRPAEDLLIG